MTVIFLVRTSVACSRYQVVFEADRICELDIVEAVAGLN